MEDNTCVCNIIDHSDWTNITGTKELGYIENGNEFKEQGVIEAVSSSGSSLKIRGIVRTSDAIWYRLSGRSRRQAGIAFKPGMEVFITYVPSPDKQTNWIQWIEARGRYAR